MSDYVTDTHALCWYLTASPNLGANAQAAFLAGEPGQFHFVDFRAADVLPFDILAAIPDL